MRIPAKMECRIAKVEAGTSPAADQRPIKDKIAALEEEMDRLEKLEVRMLEAPDELLSLTSGIVGYNVQAAVATDSHIIDIGPMAVEA